MPDFRRASDRTMHQQNTELLKEVGEIKGSLNRLIENQKEHNQRVEKQIDGIDDRLRETEKKAAVSGALAGAIMSAAALIAGYFLGPKS